MKIHKKVVWGEFLMKMPGRNRFGEELNIFDFTWGELTLDETMRVGKSVNYFMLNHWLLNSHE